MILQHKFYNVVPFQNGDQITDFYFASFRFWPKFEEKTKQNKTKTNKQNNLKTQNKNVFQKDFLNEILLQVAKHE